MIQIPKDFREFLLLLHFHRVEYLLIGGYAVGYHGYPRATVDMDIWIDQSEINADRLVRVLKEFGFDVPDLSPKLFLEDSKIIRLGIPPLRIEILTSISGVRFSDCYSRRVETEIEGLKVNLINLIDLKKNKSASGRHKDLDDLENLP